MLDAQQATQAMNNLLRKILPDERARAYFDQRVEVGDDALLKYRINVRGGNIGFAFDVEESKIGDAEYVSARFSQAVEHGGLAGNLRPVSVSNAEFWSGGVDMGAGEDFTAETTIDISADPFAGYPPSVSDFVQGAVEEEGSEEAEDDSPYVFEEEIPDPPTPPAPRKPRTPTKPKSRR